MSENKDPKEIKKEEDETIFQELLKEDFELKADLDDLPI